MLQAHWPACVAFLKRCDVAYTDRHTQTYLDRHTNTQTHGHTDMFVRCVFGLQIGAVVVVVAAVAVLPLSHSFSRNEAKSLLVASLFLLTCVLFYLILFYNHYVVYGLCSSVSTQSHDERSQSHSFGDVLSSPSDFHDWSPGRRSRHHA